MPFYRDALNICYVSLFETQEHRSAERGNIPLHSVVISISLKNIFVGFEINESEEEKEERRKRLTETDVILRKLSFPEIVATFHPLLIAN